MIAVRDRLDELGDALPVVISFAPPERLAAYRDHLDVPFPVVGDVDRVLYDLLGAGRGSLRDVWSLGTLKMYGRLLRNGRKLSRPDSDTRQLGADAIVDRQGRLARLWLPPSPDARPPLDDVIAAVRRLDE